MSGLYGAPAEIEARIANSGRRALLFISIKALGPDRVQWMPIVKKLPNGGRIKRKWSLDGKPATENEIREAAREIVLSQKALIKGSPRKATNKAPRSLPDAMPSPIRETPPELLPQKLPQARRFAGLPRTEPPGPAEVKRRREVDSLMADYRRKSCTR